MRSMQQKVTAAERPTFDSLPEILDAEELATYLGMPCSTIRTLAQQDRIPSFKIGRRLKFRRQAIGQWLDGLSPVAAGSSEGSSPQQQALHIASSSESPSVRETSHKPRRR
jgi:excisionase family DNA binding protein